MKKEHWQYFSGIRFDVEYKNHVMHFEISLSEMETHHLGAMFKEPVIELYYSIDNYGPKEFAFGIPTDDEIELDTEIFSDYIDSYIDSMLKHYLDVFGDEY